MIDRLDAFVSSKSEEFISLLKDFLVIPSVSAGVSSGSAMREAVGWVQRQLRGCGLDAVIAETGGHPAVLADSGPAEGPGPTVLVYGHYDVQPVGEEALWHSPPFVPTLREGAVYARGAADDKGQLLTHILAARAFREVSGRLPVRVKYLIEGEEEVGSSHLAALVEDRRQQLECDFVVLSDTAKFDETTPAITYGTRGLVYKQLTLCGPKHDLHSGSFGGTVLNPGNVLGRVLSGLKDAEERIAIAGCYDDVRPLSAEEHQALEALPFDEQAYLRSTGSPALSGEQGYTTLERRWVRPTLDVNGVFGGFMGSGASTVIPARVGAKVSMRLVPDQRPERVSQAFDEAVRALVPPGVSLELETLALAEPYMCPIDSPQIRAAVAAMKGGFQRDPVLIREGGTLPILPLFRRVLGADSVMMGFCSPNCNAHGPNEFLGVEDFLAGIRTVVRFLDLLARA